jgi:hypothetical protein
MDAEAQVWGEAPPGVENVSVFLNGQRAATSPVNHSAAPLDRAWSVRLPPQKAQYNVEMSVSSGSSNATVLVHFGQVILCSGQSNMGMTVGYGPPHTIPPHGYGPDKPSFSADNGTAENANALRYTSKIFLFKSAQSITTNPSGFTWSDVNNETLGRYSAACWYSGVSLYETSLQASNTPLGLITAAVGGSPIEYWIPQTDPSSPNTNPCEIDTPQCDDSGGKTDSGFYEKLIKPLTPYTIGAVVWDQAERDTKCPKAMAAYPCLQKFLISSWGKAFNSTGFAFVGVQLAGYTAALKNGTGSYANLSVTSEMVFTMRLQQEAGCTGIDRCTVVPTYDVSCQAGTDGGCPYGSVHQPHKREIGRRVGQQLARLLAEPKTKTTASPASPSHLTAPPPRLLADTEAITEGPRAVAVTLVHDAADATAAGTTSSSSYILEVAFSGSTMPFHLGGTRNCTTLPGFCCDGSANHNHTVDFDATHDGSTWVNGTAATLDSDAGKVRFTVRLPGTPTRVRYTGASIWPQCAVYGADGLPAFPFELPVTAVVVGGA